MKTKSEPKASRKTKDARDLTPIEANLQRIESEENDGDPFVFDGPRVTIAATIPKKLEKVVRAMVGARGFSKVVAEALAREVIRVNREEFVGTMEAEDGPRRPGTRRARRAASLKMTIVLDSGAFKAIEKNNRRFNGVISFTTFPATGPDSSSPSSLSVDKGGNLWVVVDNGPYLTGLPNSIYGGPAVAPDDSVWIVLPGSSYRPIGFGIFERGI